VRKLRVDMIEKRVLRGTIQLSVTQQKEWLAGDRRAKSRFGATVGD
jgi:hypothetical protein